MIKVIIISGSGGVGKSTFVNLCREYGSTYGLTIYELSVVDNVKEIALQIGWDGVKDNKGRRFLSDLKDALARYDNIPIKAVEKKMAELDGQNTIFFINAREPEDIKYFVDNYNATTLLVTNKNIPLITSNHADSDVFRYDYDYVIKNDYHLGKLKIIAQNFVTEIYNKK